MKAEYRDNEKEYLDYYDEVEICAESAEKHPKSATPVIAVAVTLAAECAAIATVAFAPDKDKPILVRICICCSFVKEAVAKICAKFSAVKLDAATSAYYFHRVFCSVFFKKYICGTLKNDE